MLRGSGLLFLMQLGTASAGGIVWGTPADDWTLTFWTTAGLVAIAMVYDFVLHTLSHWLQHRAEGDHGHGYGHGHGGKPKFDTKDYAGSVSIITYKIWVRFQSESASAVQNEAHPPRLGMCASAPTPAFASRAHLCSDGPRLPRFHHLGGQPVRGL